MKIYCGNMMLTNKFLNANPNIEINMDSIKVTTVKDVPYFTFEFAELQDENKREFEFGIITKREEITHIQKYGWDVNLAYPFMLNSSLKFGALFSKERGAVIEPEKEDKKEDKKESKKEVEVSKKEDKEEDKKEDKKEDRKEVEVSRKEDKKKSKKKKDNPDFSFSLAEEDK